MPIVTVTEMLEARPGIGNSRYCTMISLKKGLQILLYSGLQP